MIFVCTGSQCEDPGRPPDGSAKVTSFEEGQVVIFSCEREGFEPSPHNMTCTSFDNSGTPAVEWRDNDGVNHPNISCVGKKIYVYSLVKIFQEFDVHNSRLTFFKIVTLMRANLISKFLKAMLSVCTHVCSFGH